MELSCYAAWGSIIERRTSSDEQIMLSECGTLALDGRDACLGGAIDALWSKNRSDWQNVVTDLCRYTKARGCKPTDESVVAPGT